jgi:Flp pilus assembly protein TadB
LRNFVVAPPSNTSPVKLFDTLLLSLGVALVIMGIYELMTAGPMYAYTFIMPSIVAFLWFVYRKRSKV